MSVFRNLPWRAKQAKIADKFGGLDWCVVDAPDAIVAEAFQIVGQGDERDAEALAHMIADMANRTVELS